MFNYREAVINGGWQEFSAWLLHRSVVFNIDGESYRMRSHRARSEATRKAVHSPHTK